jgi:hypothetical protein
MISKQQMDGCRNGNAGLGQNSGRHTARRAVLNNGNPQATKLASEILHG